MPWDLMGGAFGFWQYLERGIMQAMLSKNRLAIKKLTNHRYQLMTDVVELRPHDKLKTFLASHPASMLLLACPLKACGMTTD